MNERTIPIDIDKKLFQKIGYKLVDEIAEFFNTVHRLPVTTGESPKQLQALLPQTSMPNTGTAADDLFDNATNLLINHSLFNGHPKFFGYITSSPAPAGALADMLAAAVNANVGANILSPMATAIEKQTIQWLAEFIGVSTNYGGILVSGGNMANFTCFLVGRTIKAPKNIKENGINNDVQKLTVYCPKTTHTWIEKAAVLFGLGTKAVRWVDVDEGNKMKNDELERMIAEDKQNGCTPVIVVGTAGDVSTGAVDDLKGIASICKKYDLWFHVDGAYGIPAAVVPEFKPLFEGIEEADSVALDPHKWLYSPLEAGCALVKNPNHLTETYSSHPVYYNFNSDGEPATLNYYEYGLQNSRGFRALKVWINLQYVGRNGYERMISDDIALSKLLYTLSSRHEELEALTQNLSITTFRYVPKGFKGNEDKLNKLNEKLLNTIQHNGEAFLSNAVINGKYCLRACIVNFRTTEKDIRELIEIVVKEGRKLITN